MRTFEINSEIIRPEETCPSKTYAMKGSRVEGYIDGLEAVKQAVCKILETERFEYPVYSFSYGANLQKLLGKERLYVQAELPRMIEEALLGDKRIKRVTDFRFLFEGDLCQCDFTVHSAYGAFAESLEVGV